MIIDAGLTNYKKKPAGDKKRVEELWRTMKPTLRIEHRKRKRESNFVIYLIYRKLKYFLFNFFNTH